MIYKTELRFMTSQIELLTRDLYFDSSFRVTNSSFFYLLKSSKLLKVAFFENFINLKIKKLDQLGKLLCVTRKLKKK